MPFANGVKELTLTTGTGAVTLTPISGYVPFFAAFSISDLVPYAINDGLNWEWGVGTVGAANTLARTTVQSTYVSGTLTTSGATPINLSGGATVFCTITAEEYALVAAGGVTGGDSHNHTGGGGAQIDYTDLASLPTLGSAAATDSTDYAPVAKGVTGGDSHNHDGGDGAQIAYAALSGAPTLGTAAAAATGDFEASGAVSTHNAASGAHGATATGAAVLTAASQSAGRTALGLGTAATTASTAYATATQGSNADSHASNTSNPHSVTAAQVGAPSGSGNSTGTNTGNETPGTIGTMLGGATSKTTPVDADRLALWNSVSGLLEYLSWANLKATLESVFLRLSGTSQTVAGTVNFAGTLTAVTASTGVNNYINVENPTVRTFFGVGGGGTAFGIGSYTNHGILFYTNFAEKMRISASGGLTLGAFTDPGAGNLFVFGAGGFGTSSASAKIHAVSTAEQLRCGYDAANYWNAVTSSVGVTTFNMVGTAPAAVFSVSDATANAIYDVFTVAKNSSGAGGAGLGARLLWAAKSSTTASTRQASLASEWVDATHSTRKARITISASDYSGAREGFRCESDGTQIKTSVNGVAAVARAAALTAEIPGDATRDELRLTELYNACKNFGIIN